MGWRLWRAAQDKCLVGLLGCQVSGGGRVLIIAMLGSLLMREVQFNTLMEDHIRSFGLHSIHMIMWIKLVLIVINGI